MLHLQLLQFCVVKFLLADESVLLSDLQQALLVFALQILDSLVFLCRREFVIVVDFVDGVLVFFLIGGNAS